MVNNESIIILDFGSQYTQVIARKIRELGVYAEILPFSVSEEELSKHNPKGLILSGGPSSVFAEGAPIPTVNIFDRGIPVLGICYGLQLIALKMVAKLIKLLVENTAELSSSLMMIAIFSMVYQIKLLFG